MERINLECYCSNYSKRPIVSSVSSSAIEQALFAEKNGQLICKRCGRIIREDEIKKRIKYVSFLTE